MQTGRADVADLGRIDGPWQLGRKHLTLSRLGDPPMPHLKLPKRLSVPDVPPAGPAGRAGPIPGGCSAWEGEMAPVPATQMLEVGRTPATRPKVLGRVQAILETMQAPYRTAQIGKGVWNRPPLWGPLWGQVEQLGATWGAC